MTTARDREGIFNPVVRFFAQSARQLWFDKEQPFLRGAEHDIAKIRKLDKAIGKILKRFNGVSAVPEKDLKTIEATVDKLYPLFRNVSAWKPYQKNLVEMTLGKGAGKEIQVRVLEYNNYFTSPSGTEIEQRIAKIRLG